MVRRAGEASSMCFSKEVKSTMATASYNTLLSFRSETSTGSARNLVPPKRAMTATGSTAETPASRTSGMTSTINSMICGAPHPQKDRMPQTRVSRKGIASLPKGSLDPPHRNVWIALKENTTYSRKGALTSTRSLLVNARLTGETCAKNFADTC